MNPFLRPLAGLLFLFFASLAPAQYLSSITFEYPSYIAGSAGIKHGIVQLGLPALVNTTVALDWSDTYAQGPASVVIKQGYDRAFFNFTTPERLPAGTPFYNGTLQASRGGAYAGTITQSLPTYLLRVTGVANGAQRLMAGYNYNVKVTMNAAPYADMVLRPAVDVPSSWITLPGDITLPAGQRTLTFDMYVSFTFDPGAGPNFLVVGDPDNEDTSMYLVQDALAVKAKSLVLASPTLTGGQSTTATLTLNYTMQTDLVIPVSCANSHVSVPATVTIPAGSDHITFNVSTTAIPATKVANILIKCQLGDPLLWFGYYVQKSAPLTINP
jgi:hypothetical protein